MLCFEKWFRLRIPQLHCLPARGSQYFQNFYQSTFSFLRNYFHDGKTFLRLTYQWLGVNLSNRK